MEPDSFAGDAAQSMLSTLHAPLAHNVGLLDRVSGSDVPVLFLGETGTGKEVLARALHARSNRPGPFVAVNCGGLAPTLVEAELFGHRRGAFSGAVVDRPGYLRSADRGTLFLDEIGELSAAAQTALLRALQEHEVIVAGPRSNDVPAFGTPPGPGAHGRHRRRAPGKPKVCWAEAPAYATFSCPQELDGVRLDGPLS